MILVPDQIWIFPVRKKIPLLGYWVVLIFPVYFFFPFKPYNSSFLPGYARKIE